MSTRSFSKYPIGSPEYNAEYVGYKTIDVAIIFMVFEAVFTILRLISRYLTIASWGLDDFFIIPSMIFCFGTCILSIVIVDIGGTGRHEPALLASDHMAIVNWAKCLVAVEIVYCTAVIFPKLSILSFYLRIFPQKAFRITAYTIASIITANAFAGVVTSLTSCRPLAGRWEPSLPGATCIDIDEYWRWISFANIFTDVIMLAMPLPSIWKLQTTTNEKIGLIAVFLTGSVGLISSIVRFTIFFDTEGFIDRTWTSANLTIWTVVEPGMYHIAACLPILRSLIMRLRHRLTKVAKSQYMNQHRHESSRGGNKNNRMMVRNGMGSRSDSFTQIEGDHKTIPSANDLSDEMASDTIFGEE